MSSFRRRKKQIGENIEGRIHSSKTDKQRMIDQNQFKSYKI